jgi:hypothetical protein
MIQTLWRHGSFGRALIAGIIREWIMPFVSSHGNRNYYVNRKIKSYIYLWIFTKSIWLHVKHFIALTKRQSVRRIIFCNYRSYPCQHIGQWPRKIRENCNWWYYMIPASWRHGSFVRALIACIIREWNMPFVSSHWRVLKK